MAVSYDLGPQPLDDLHRELDRLTGDAIAEGRSYSVHISRAGAGQFKALLTVHDRPNVAEGGAA